MVTYRRRFQSKYLISAPAPLGRILNYVKRIKGKQYATSERGPRKSSNLDDWTICFMVGLNLIKEPSLTPSLKIFLTAEGKRVYEIIKRLPDFPDHPRTKGRADMLSIKNDLVAHKPQLYRELRGIFLDSDVMQNLLTFLKQKNVNTMNIHSFYKEYGEIFGIKKAGFNRLPSLIQIAEFCDILHEEGNVIRLVEGALVRHHFDSGREHLRETKRKLGQAGETTPEEEDFLADVPMNLSPKKRQLVTTLILRDARISTRLKALYGNKCQICRFTFPKKRGGLYSESHHLVPLGRKGADVISNIVILCPNCHKQLHYAEVKYGKKRNNKMSLKINNVRKSINYHPNHFRAVAEPDLT